MEPSTNGDNEVRPPRPWRYPHRRYVFAGLITFGLFWAIVLLTGNHWLYGPALGIPTGLGVYVIGMALTGDLESFGNMFWRR